MTTDNVAQEEVSQQDQQDAQADDDLAAGFNKASPSGDAEVEQADDASTTQNDGNGETATGQPAAAAQDAPRIAGMSEEELRAALQQANGVNARLDTEISKLYGKIGELNRTIQEGRKSATGMSGRKITADLLKRVNEELPGLGDALAQDLNELMGAADAASADTRAAGDAAAVAGKSFDADSYFAEKLQPALAAMESNINRKAEERIVRILHSDFDQVCKSPEFAEWLGKQPADRQTEILNSEDATVAGKAVTDFKDFQKRSVAARAGNRRRLEAAVVPDNGGAGAPGAHHDSEEAELSAGFANVRKNRASG